MSQPVDFGCSFGLPVNVAKMASGVLTGSPLTSFLVVVIAFFVLMAIVAVPVSALLNVPLFPGLLPNARSLGGGGDISEALEKLTGSRTMEDFLSEPLDDFLRRVMGGEEARTTQNVGDFVSRVAKSLTSVLSILDYDNAFAAVQVPGEGCRQRLMCHVHTQVKILPSFLQRAYGYLGPHLEHQQQYSRAIVTGLGGGNCNKAFPHCPYDVPQMAAFIPFLQNKGYNSNRL